MRRLMILSTSLALAACANGPGAPGMGYGQNYTPLVDTNGLDMQRYSNDLAGCRSLAAQIDPNKMARDQMVGGILVGALLGAAAGGNRYWAQQGAIAGGTAGVGAGGARGVMKQETVMANCMAGRGYRVLDATVQTNTSVPSPYVQSAGYAPTATARPSPTLPAAVQVQSDGQPIQLAPASSQPAQANATTYLPAASIPGCGWQGGYQWKCPGTTASPAPQAEEAPSTVIRQLN